MFRWYVITSSILQYCSAFCVRFGMNLLNKPLHNIQMLYRIDNEISHPFQSINSAFHVRFGTVKSVEYASTWCPHAITHGQLSIVSVISPLVLFMSDSVEQNLPHPPLCNVQIVCWIDKCVLYPFHSILVPFVSDSVLPNLLNLPLCDMQMVC